ncbi:MAG: hypothetical protein ACRECH_11520 [Nitrososphaerales archaeon]
MEKGKKGQRSPCVVTNLGDQTESFPINGYWPSTSGSRSSSNYLECAATYYIAQAEEILSNTSTIYTTTTQSSVSSFATTTSVNESAGYVTTTTIYPTTTETGVLQSTMQVCTFTTK